MLHKSIHRIRYDYDKVMSRTVRFCFIILFIAHNDFLTMDLSAFKAVIHGFSFAKVFVNEQILRSVDDT